MMKVGIFLILSVATGVSASTLAPCDPETQEWLEQRCSGPVFRSDRNCHQARMVRIDSQLTQVGEVRTNSELFPLVKRFRDGALYVKWNKPQGESEWFYWSRVGRDKFLTLYIAEGSSLVFYGE